MSLSQALYAISTILTGLVAGLFYGYQCSVIGGLGNLGNREYLLAFKSINAAILNPVFFLSFIGSLLVLIATTFVAYRNQSPGLLPYLCMSTAIYAIAVFGITAACNVPLNEQVAAFDVQGASEAEVAKLRLAFEATWNKWHLLRTIASVAAFITLVLPLVKRIQV
ncbi:DUF1772 domain-containing protein [Pedobacter yulinensis]|uniref:DUF1772 domain-containing protein n=2 Tax=Pedobacter yulinensis TaxID=2126353 RepID=A0A2T3HPZ6_9SPHI|nr:DUF1772 domain-containing protein [Pedobacter yulinensis]